MKIQDVVVIAGAALFAAQSASAVTVWDADDGTIVITQPDDVGADPPNRVTDPITPDVSLGRGAEGPIIDMNPSGSTDVGDAPRWAFSDQNGNPTFAFGEGAESFAALTFSNPMSGALSSQIGNFIENRPGVLYLPVEDIYVDIIFSHWQMGGGGGFTYERAIPTPGAIALFGLAGLGAVRRRR